MSSTNPAATTPLQAAVAETKTESHPHTITVLGRSFRLIPKMTLAASVEFDEAQREENLAKMVSAAARLVHKDERESFVEFLFEEPDDGEAITPEAFGEIIADALEAISGRPLGNTNS